MKKIILFLFLAVCLVLFRVGLYEKGDNNKKDLEKTNSTFKTYDSSKDLFADKYVFAKKKVKTMSLDEKISQLLLVRYPDEDQVNILKKYQFGGYIFFSKDFKDKTKEEVIDMMNNLQSVSKVPILTAVDEEGGIVVRVSSNKNLRSEPFKSSQDLYKEGGFQKIKEDTIEKSSLLKSLGINLNLAPVVDISTNPDDYMYKRTIGEDRNITSKYAETVIGAGKNSGVSYTLKHFPGYGNNIDTHSHTSVDPRSYEDIMENDIKPFEAGIKSGCESIMVSHNIVSSIDNENTASLSKKVHDVLYKKLSFSGVVITDDLAMGATKDIEDAAVKAVNAGNDLLIVTDYEKRFQEIKNAINSGDISEKRLNKSVTKLLAWKYYKGLIS